ncbi:MAG TPA: hypothetical protein VJA21_17565, partial [Verrucomicrobiae bacterium]
MPTCRLTTDHGPLFTVDPCEYPGWDELLLARADASIFHGGGWARVLKATYGHRPMYLCRIADGRLRELLTLMEVSSRWTGKRGVALPFTDFVCALGGEGGQVVTAPRDIRTSPAISAASGGESPSPP